MSATVFDLDDLCDAMDPWDELHALKEQFPNLKVTLFAVPGRCSQGLLERYSQVPWVELAVHGYHHSSMECAAWGYDEAAAKLAEIAEFWPGARLFKAPGWMASEEVYAALLDGGWMVADNMEQVMNWGNTELNRYVYNAVNRFESIHGHTWNVCGNGPRDWPAMFADVPRETEFAFVSEVCEHRSVWANRTTIEEEYRYSPIHRVLAEIDLEAGELVVDLGAYTGAEIQACTEQGFTVLSMEPQKRAFDVLHELWGSNPQVELVWGCALDHDGEIELYVNDPRHSSSNSQSGASVISAKVNVVKSGVKVPCYDIGKMLDNRQVGLLKINVEGAEWRILERILDTCGFSNIRHVYVEDHTVQIKDPAWVEHRARVRERLREAGVEVKPW
jgi:FkbM family methyltransferase